MNKRTTQPPRRGAVIILVALVIPTLLVIVGFSVDLAQIQRTRTELRAVTDVAAKAAGITLADTGDLELAMNTAQEIASANQVDGVPLTLASGDFTFGHSAQASSGKWEFTPGGAPTNALRLTARRTEDSDNGPVNLFFSGMLGYKFEPTATATAMFVAVDVCMVLDRSGSMKKATDDPSSSFDSDDPRVCDPPWPDSRWIALENAVNVFVDQLSASLAQEHVAVVTFAGGTVSRCGETNTDNSVDQGLTPDLSLVTAAVNVRSNTVWNGSTKTREAIMLARNVLTGPDARPTAQKIMILFTDGVYTSGDPVPQAADAFNIDNITVHTITFGVGANQSDMQAVAAAGQGQHYHAPDPATLNDIFYKLAGTITILTE